MCIICKQEQERLMATCCGGMVCEPCIDKCDEMGLAKCVWCRQDVWDQGFIDIPHAYNVYHKV